MHNLSNFTPYTDQSLSGESVVLVWSRSTGYYFTQLGFITDLESVKIIGIKEKVND